MVAESVVPRERPTGAAARVAHALLEGGPQTASALAERLGLTGTAVRKQLDALQATGVVEACERPPYGPAAGRTASRGRGRPARFYAMSSAGREVFESGYDDLAAEALRYLAEAAGDDAVLGFARGRAAALEARHADVAVLPAGARPTALAAALAVDGFAATAVDVPLGVQLCQHHCPVMHVAAEFPQLCEAEAEAFSRLLGTHVTRLATLAHGDGVCTTLVPVRGTGTHPGEDPS